MPYRRWKIKNNIFGIFYYFTIERAKIQCKQAENNAMCTEKLYYLTPMPKLVRKIFFRQFQSWGCTTSWKASWSRCGQNKVVSRCKSSNNNSKDCRKIKSVKSDRSQAHETPRINFQPWHRGPSCSYRKKFVSFCINDCDTLIRRQRNDRTNDEK